MRPKAAREPILREAIALLEASPARLDLAEARTLLGEPERGTDIAQDSPIGRRVAELAARGYSDREIAEALFITTKAVEDELRGR